MSFEADVLFDRINELLVDSELSLADMISLLYDLINVYLMEEE